MVYTSYIQVCSCQEVLIEEQMQTLIFTSYIHPPMSILLYLMVSNSYYCELKGFDFNTII